jgi:hypothetical protein
MPLRRNKGKKKRKTKSQRKKKTKRKQGSEPEVPTGRPTPIGKVQHATCTSFSGSHY